MTRAGLAVMLLASLAHADAAVSQAPERFDRFVRDLAARRGQRLVASWAVNLDGEPDLERVAVLYDDDGENGDFIIEKRARRRWDVRFNADGRTLPSATGELVPAADIQPFYRGPHGRRPHTILYRFGHRGGYSDTLLALRDGRVAVVYEEELDDARESLTPSATDWDALVRRKQARYRFIVPDGDAGSDGSLTLRSLE